jgi:hypothetical protein
MIFVVSGLFSESPVRECHFSPLFCSCVVSGNVEFLFYITTVVMEVARTEQWTALCLDARRQSASLHQLQYRSNLCSGKSLRCGELQCLPYVVFDLGQSTSPFLSPTSL